MFDNETNPGNFFKHIDCLLGKNTKPRWTLLSMYPGASPPEVVERLAEFFNNISCEYSPLQNDSIPMSFSRSLPTLTEQQVED